MARQIEFLVKGIVEGVSGHFHVIGRNCGDAIQTGDTLVSAFRYADIIEPDGTQSERQLDLKSVKLFVERIHAYGHDLNELGSGMTGSLDLNGIGTAAVAPGCMLGAVVESVNGDPRPVTDAPSSSHPL